MVKFFDMELANKNIDLKGVLNDVSKSYRIFAWRFCLNLRT